MIRMKNIFSIIVFVSSFFFGSSWALQHSCAPGFGDSFKSGPKDTGFYFAGQDLAETDDLLQRVGEIEGQGRGIYLGEGTILTAAHNHVRPISFAGIWHQGYTNTIDFTIIWHHGYSNTIAFTIIWQHGCTNTVEFARI